MHNFQHSFDIEIANIDNTHVFSTHRKSDPIRSTNAKCLIYFSYITIHFTPGYSFAMIVEITLQDTYMINCLK